MNPKPEKPARSSMASTKADLREMRENSRATVAEIQAFLSELKGKSPQEMLGMVTASSLFRPLLLSTALVAAALLLFTAIPYFMAGDPDPPAAATTETPKTDPAPEQTTPPDESPQPDIDSLGIDEARDAPPDVNPLENQTDDLLKDLE